MVNFKTETNESNLVHFQASRYGPVCVYDNGLYRWLTFGEDNVDSIIIQGATKKDQPHKIMTPVNQCLLLFLLDDCKALTLLNLGLGAGGIERAVNYLNTYTETTKANTDGKLSTKLVSQIDTVEINPEIINVAKQYFYLPDITSVVVSCAQQYLNQCITNYDVFTVDIFNGDHHQGFIQTQSFWQSVKSRIKTNGRVLVNLNPTNDQQLQHLLLIIRQYFKCIALVEFNDYKNIVLVASNETLKGYSLNSIQASSHLSEIASNLHESIKVIHSLEKHLKL